jgi:bifunctional non-homologous end joining protein LigD
MATKASRRDIAAPVLSYAVVPLLPMSVGDGPAPFRATGWTYELKFDGWRCLALIVAGEVRLYSRNGKDITKRFPEFDAIAHDVTGDALLDGEIIGGDGTLASFRTLLSREALRTFVAFDALAIDGKPITSKPLEYRRRVLHDVARDGGQLVLSRSFDDGAALYAEGIARGYEGVIAKRAGSIYRPGERTRDWLKIKSTDATTIVRKRFDR